MIQKKPRAKSGIAHTRWATHGQPSQKNAHPHESNGSIYIVHNGIIENYSSLKQILIEKGYEFNTDTDTEVLINLIEYIQIKEKIKLGEAVQMALQQVVGAYSIAVIDIKKPDEIVVARLGSPLCIGIGNNEHFIGSDVTPFLDHTKDVVYLEDGEMAIIRNHKRTQYRKIDDDSFTNPTVEKLEIDLAKIQKQ